MACHILVLCHSVGLGFSLAQTDLEIMYNGFNHRGLNGLHD